MLKKILLSTLVGISLITSSVSAGERMTKDNEYKPHTECFMHPVLVKQEEVLDNIHSLVYMRNVYYDVITKEQINTDYETIYMDDEDNRWYFPFDHDKYHKHEGERMSFEKGYEEE